MKATPKTTYLESAKQLATKARTELLKGASQDWTEAKAKATEAGKLELQSLNLLRSAGVKLQEACDHENLSLESFATMRPALPKDMGFLAAKFCVSLGKEFDQPIKSLDDARAARRVLFEKLSEANAPRRLEQQCAHESNPWSELVSRGSSVIALISDMEEAEPMDKWGKDKLRSFITTYKPIADKHAEAVRLQAAK
jgi:hypothetical protein